MDVSGLVSMGASVINLLSVDFLARILSQLTKKNRKSVRNACIEKQSEEHAGVRRKSTGSTVTSARPVLLGRRFLTAL
jgi:hypothetical protein